MAIFKRKENYSTENNSEKTPEINSGAFHKDSFARKKVSKSTKNNSSNSFASPADFLDQFEQERGLQVKGDTSFEDIAKTIAFSLKTTDLVSEEDKKILKPASIENIVQDLKIKALYPDEVAKFDMENIKILYDQQIKLHKNLLRKIPKLREQVEQEVSIIKAKVPRIKQQKIREMRRATDKHIIPLQKEINDIRIRISVLKEQINQMARKFKSIETQIIENKASDRSVMKVVSSLSEESSDAIKSNLKNFSDSNLTEKSRSMYNSVLVAIRKVIGNIKADIDKLAIEEEDKVNVIKELEFDFQIASGRHSSITKDLQFAIKKEQESVEKLFELALNISSENVSILQRKYNQQLIDAEEETFEIKMDQMVKSIESAKIGLNFSKEISEIEREVGDIDDAHFDDDEVQEITREVEIMIKGDDSDSVGYGDGKKPKVTKLKKN